MPTSMTLHMICCSQLTHDHDQRTVRGSDSLVLLDLRSDITAVSPHRANSEHPHCIHLKRRLSSQRLFCATRREHVVNTEDRARDRSSRWVSSMFRTIKVSFDLEAGYIAGIRCPTVATLILPSASAKACRASLQYANGSLLQLTTQEGRE